MNDPMQRMPFHPMGQPNSMGSNNVGYEPGQLGWANPTVSKFFFQRAQYDALFGEMDERDRYRAPITFAITNMIIGTLGLMIVGAFMGGLAWAFWQVSWLLAIPLNAMLLYFFLWMAWVIYWRGPVTALIIHRGRRGASWKRLAWTDKYRARWFTDDYLAEKYGA